MDNIDIICTNTGKTYSCKPGITLVEFLKTAKPGLKYPALAAYADNKLKSLTYKVFNPHIIEFVDMTALDGRRTYIRSLSFVLQKAVADLYKDKVLILGFALPGGLYAELRDVAPDEDGRTVVSPITSDDVTAIKSRMGEIIAADLPFTREKVKADEAMKIFLSHNCPEKAKLVETTGKCFISVYYLDGYGDTFYGPLLPSTGMIKVWDVVPYLDGFLLQFPEVDDPEKIPVIASQQKLYEVMKENANWCRIMGVSGVGSLNAAITSGHSKELIQVAEALHEKRYAQIADEIYAKRDQVRMVLIAGPSSSGKTTTSKRLALQCKVTGLNPKVIAMDNYFVDREHTPKDEKGDFDFESIYALDLEFLNQQLTDLLDGKEIDVPTFNFAEGSRSFDGEKMILGEKDILIMEGIHALNPMLTKAIPNSKKCRIFSSALTSLVIDENNNMSTTDNRLLRRIVRDNNFRGISPEETIIRWPSVRRGEVKNIFPFQENADLMFNSALIFELPLLKYYAEPLLRRVPATSEAHGEAIRLLRFLDLIVAMTPEEIQVVPPTSVIKEFIGGSSFKY
jgi:uridine kinase